ncbi:MAG: arylamine N-acetyltransferase [Candidatus Velthaea sp.]
MDITRYLRRIGYAGDRTPSTATLAALQRAHLERVPFENLWVVARRPLLLDEPALFAKIVDGARGGICYELNALFAWLLRELGFAPELVNACVARPDGGWTAPYDHLALVVPIEGRRLLADVGFGDGFGTPLDLAGGACDGYQLVRDGVEHVVLALRRAQGDSGDGAWEPQYRCRSCPHHRGLSRPGALASDRCRWALHATPALYDGAPRWARHARRRHTHPHHHRR